ncbi:tape measure protein [Pusillimonas sp. ANT_WB101]|uniref:tape measure protein n=1 Tax=Pusillimonas sp. ANT_WB101 TaxID=2597356 RepID=UPI0011EDB961|nr:tape measure protein [Pusillimonas sp. ANT_WB101]KAA0910687.1 tape measure protein [Pusillimonas sp. ANT_WB101]
MPEGLNTGSVYFTVEADTSKLLGANTDADRSLDSLNKQFAKTDKAANDTQFQMTKTATAVKSIGAESNAARSGVAGLYGALAGLVTLRAAGSLIEMADAYNEMAERISMATASQEEYEHVQQRLLATANGTYRSLSEAQELYVLTSSTLKSLGYDTDQSMDIVDSLSYSFVKNATAADRAKGAINAVTGSLNKGKVDAQAWQTILAATPSIVDDLAAATGRTTKEILQLGAQGKLTGRDLSGTLLKSLDANKKAADDMATTVADAFTNLRNNLSVFIGEANRSSGATQILSGALVMLGENIDTIVKLLMVAGAGALAKYIAQMGAAAIASGRAMLAARAQAAEELRLATAHRATASAALANATANRGLTVSHGQAAAAATAHAAAVSRAAAAQAAAVGVARTLLGVLGGPIGIIALLASAAVAAVTFGRDSKNASSSVNTLSGAVNGLTASLKELDRAGLESAASSIQGRIEQSARLAVTAQDELQKLQAQLANETPGSDASKNVIRQMEGWGAAYGEAQKQLEVLRKRQDEIAEMGKRRADAAAAPVGQEADPEVAKSLKSMREQLELAKLTGAARARLQAIQRLGANATAEERAEAEKLATQIYELEKAQKGVGAATKESAAAAKENAKAIADMRQELAFAALSGMDLAKAKAEAKLNPFATPEDVATLRALAEQLYEIEALKELQKKVGDDPNKYVQGDVSPLSGGAFDDQTARYEAEAVAEQERYTAQLERLREAMEAQKFTLEEYYAEFESLTQTHADRMAQIDQAKTSVMLMSASNGFGALADMLKQSQGEQSKAYKAMFAVSKAFSVANASLALFTAISEAWKLPWPANIPAIAAAATAMGTVISSVSSVSMGGARQYGGPVAENTMHRINEGGKPEVLNMANGKQFLLPNGRGEVVSNRDATSGGGNAPNVTVVINNAPEGTRVEQRQISDAEFIVDVMIADVATEGRFTQAGSGALGWRRTGQ